MRDDDGAVKDWMEKSWDGRHIKSWGGNIKIDEEGQKKVFGWWFAVTIE